MEVESLVKELLETNKCYILDCGTELFVWIGKTTSLEDRKNASEAGEVICVSLSALDPYILT